MEISVGLSVHVRVDDANAAYMVSEGWRWGPSCGDRVLSGAGGVVGGKKGRRESGLAVRAVLRFNPHHRRLHDGYVSRGLVWRVRVDVGGGDADGASDANGCAFGDEALADRRGEHVDLELHAEDRRPLGHLRQAGVAARGIGDGCDRAGVGEAVLLTVLVRPREFDMNNAVGDVGETRAQRREELLTLERSGDPVVKR